MNDDQVIGASSSRNRREATDSKTVQMAHVSSQREPMEKKRKRLWQRAHIATSLGLSAYKTGKWARGEKGEEWTKRGGYVKYPSAYMGGEAKEIAIVQISQCIITSASINSHCWIFAAS